jgi:hypothetical protein
MPVATFYRQQFPRPRLQFTAQYASAYVRSRTVFAKPPVYSERRNSVRGLHLDMNIQQAQATIEFLLHSIMKQEN